MAKAEREIKLRKLNVDDPRIVDRIPKDSKVLDWYGCEKRLLEVDNQERTSVILFTEYKGKTLAVTQDYTMSGAIMQMNTKLELLRGDRPIKGFLTIQFGRDQQEEEAPESEAKESVGDNQE